MKGITRARRVTAQQEAADVLVAAQGLVHMTRYDNNLRRFACATEVERECHQLLEFLELVENVDGRSA